MSSSRNLLLSLESDNKDFTVSTKTRIDKSPSHFSICRPRYSETYAITQIILEVAKIKTLGEVNKPEPEKHNLSHLGSTLVSEDFKHKFHVIQLKQLNIQENNI